MGVLTRGAAVVALMLAAAGCGSGAGANGEDDKIVVSAFTNSPVSTIDQMVVRMGFLEDEGIDAEILEIPSGPDMVASLIGGTAQVTGGSPALVWPLLEQDQCIKYLAPGMGNMYNLIARSDVDLPNADQGFPESVQDLKGKTIGIVARGSATEVWASAVLRDAGLDPAKDVTFIAVGAAGTALPAFQEQQVDALLTYPPLTQMIEAEGIEYEVVADMVGGNPDTLEQMLQVGSVVTCEFAEQNPDVVDAYCNAVDKAYAFLEDEANAEEMGEFMSEILDVDGATGADIWENVKTAFPSPEMTEELWNAQIEFLPAMEGKIPTYDESVLTDCG